MLIGNPVKVSVYYLLCILLYACIVRPLSALRSNLSNELCVGKVLASCALACLRPARFANDLTVISCEVKTSYADPQQVRQVVQKNLIAVKLCLVAGRPKYHYCDI